MVDAVDEEKVVTDSQINDDTVDVDKIVKTKFPARLQINTPGICCQPWSSEGSNGRDSTEMEIPSAVHLVERLSFQQAQLEDISFGECTPRYPVTSRIGDYLFAIAETGLDDRRLAQSWSS